MRDVPLGPEVSVDVLQVNDQGSAGTRRNEVPDDGVGQQRGHERRLFGRSDGRPRTGVRDLGGVGNRRGSFEGQIPRGRLGGRWQRRQERPRETRPRFGRLGGANALGHPGPFFPKAGFQPVGEKHLGQEDRPRP